MAASPIQSALDLAKQHHQAGRLNEAERLYRQVLAQQPEHAEALLLLGVMAGQMGHHDKALELIHQAIALEPHLAKAHYNLGVVLQAQGCDDQAVPAFRQAVALKPDWPEAQYNLAVVLQAQGDLDQAISTYHQAITLKPNWPEALTNLGHALQARGNLDEALAACRQAVALNPNYPKGHHNLSLALLAKGDFARGWEEYEWRRQCKDFTATQRNFTQPQWDGHRLDGRTLLLHAEQGFGDTIQFIRYLPLVAQRGGRMIVECPREVQRLVAALNADIPVVAKGQILPAFDVHRPLLSVPRLFATDLTNIPANVPYLHANAAEVRQWQARLAAYGPAWKVGLVWGGRAKPDPNRSRGLQRLAPLANVKGVTFFSLQMGEPAKELTQYPPELNLIDLTGHIRDFADTAALIANLDLVISIDTAVAHLAGALAKPVWILLPYVADWRWLLNRQDSPWYPTMRLFRQPAIGDWVGVVHAVAEALAGLVSHG